MVADSHLVSRNVRLGRVPVFRYAGLTKATDEMLSESARERELGPLQSIRDAYEKVVVVKRGSYEPDVDGIAVVPAKDFFLGDRI